MKLIAKNNIIPQVQFIQEEINKGTIWKNNLKKETDDCDNTSRDKAKTLYVYLNRPLYLILLET